MGERPVRDADGHCWRYRAGTPSCRPKGVSGFGFASGVESGVINQELGSVATQLSIVTVFMTMLPAR